MQDPRCYKGKPTTNNLAADRALGQVGPTSSGDFNSCTYTLTSNYNYSRTRPDTLRIQTTNNTGYIRVDYQSTVECQAGTNYVFSFDYKPLGRDSSTLLYSAYSAITVYGNGYKVPDASEAASGQTYTTLYLGDGWRRRVFKYTATYTGYNYIRTHWYTGTQQGDATLGDVDILIDNIMFEQGTYYSGFTTGTRGVLDCVYDLGPYNSTIDVTSANFSSSNPAEIYYTASKLIVSDGDHLDGWDGCTFEAWVKPNTSGNYHRIFDKNYSTAYNFSISSDNTFYMYHSGDWKGSTVTVDTGKWNHLVITYDGSYVFFYKNGVQTNSTAWARGPMPSNTDPLSIGANYFDLTSDTRGEIDVAKIYSRPLTASEVLQNFNALRSRYGL